MIELDITLFIQLCNFLIALMGINYLLVKPIRTIIQQRKENMAQTVDATNKLIQEVQEKLSYYTESIAKEKDKAMQNKNKMIIDAENETATLIATVRKETQQSIKINQETVNKEAQATYEEIQKNISTFASSALTRIFAVN